MPATVESNTGSNISLPLVVPCTLDTAAASNSNINALTASSQQLIPNPSSDSNVSPNCNEESSLETRVNDANAGQEDKVSPGTPLFQPKTERLMNSSLTDTSKFTEADLNPPTDLRSTCEERNSDCSNKVMETSIGFQKQPSDKSGTDVSVNDSKTAYSAALKDVPNDGAKKIVGAGKHTSSSDVRVVSDKCISRLQDMNEWERVWDVPLAAKLASTETLGDEYSPDNVSPRSAASYVRSSHCHIYSNNGNKTGRPTASPIASSSSCHHSIIAAAKEKAPLRQSFSQASNIMPIDTLSMIEKSNSLSSDTNLNNCNFIDDLPSCQQVDNGFNQLNYSMSISLDSKEADDHSNCSESQAIGKHSEECVGKNSQVHSRDVIDHPPVDDCICEVSWIPPTCAFAPAQTSALTTSTPSYRGGADVSDESMNNPKLSDKPTCSTDNFDLPNKKSDTKEIFSKEQYSQTAKQPCFQKECQTESILCQKECQTDSVNLYSVVTPPPSDERMLKEKFKPLRPCHRAASERGAATSFQRSCSTDYGTKLYSSDHNHQHHRRQQSSDHVFNSRNTEDHQRAEVRPLFCKFFKPGESTAGVSNHRKLGIQFSDPGLCDFDGEYFQKNSRYTAVEVVTAEVLVVGSSSIQDTPMVVPSSPPDDSPTPKKRCSFVSFILFEEEEEEEEEGRGDKLVGQFVYYILLYSTVGVITTNKEKYICAHIYL